MVSGFDKYFQIAPCFRDEDAELIEVLENFINLILKCLLSNKKMFLKVIVALMVSLFKKFSAKKIMHDKFPKIPFHEAMLKYGTDKPDLRNPLIITDITNILLEMMLNLIFLKNW